MSLVFLVFQTAVLLLNKILVLLSPELSLKIFSSVVLLQRVLVSMPMALLTPGLTLLLLSLPILHLQDWSLIIKEAVTFSPLHHLDSCDSLSPKMAISLPGLVLLQDSG